jgi:hypothetical protein
MHGMQKRHTGKFNPNFNPNGCYEILTTRPLFRNSVRIGLGCLGGEEEWEMHSLAYPSPIPSLLLPFVSVSTLPARAGSAHSATGMLALPDPYYARIASSIICSLLGAP